MKKPMVDTMVRSKFDNLYTPLEAVSILFPYIPPRIKVWECCDPGNSLITKVLFELKRIDVISTDITTGFDFLKDDPKFDFDMIITNPPYSLKDKFLERCYSYGKPFALLLPLTALEGVKRNEMFNQHGISVIVIAQRLDFTGKKSCWFNTSWFCWKLFDDNRLIFERL